MKWAHVACSAVIAVVAVTFPARAAAEAPLCGIHAVFTAASLLEVGVNYEDLLRPEFVGSAEGSSIAELQRAAEQVGLHALAVSKLSTNDLRWSQWPVILHVKSELAAPKYNHFVLFAGCQ